MAAAPAKGATQPSSCCAAAAERKAAAPPTGCGAAFEQRAAAGQQPEPGLVPAGCTRRRVAGVGRARPGDHPRRARSGGPAAVDGQSGYDASGPQCKRGLARSRGFSARCAAAEGQARNGGRSKARKRTSARRTRKAGRFGCRFARPRGSRALQAPGGDGRCRSTSCTGRVRGCERARSARWSASWDRAYRAGG